METTIYHPDKGKKKVFSKEKLDAHIKVGWSITPNIIYEDVESFESRLVNKIDKRSKAYRDSK